MCLCGPSVIHSLALIIRLTFVHFEIIDKAPLKWLIITWYFDSLRSILHCIFFFLKQKEKCTNHFFLLAVWPFIKHGKAQLATLLLCNFWHKRKETCLVWYYFTENRIYGYWWSVNVDWVNIWTFLLISVIFNNLGKYEKENNLILLTFRVMSKYNNFSKK